MNISFDWLKDFVETDITPQALRDLITARVATVDAVESLRADLEAFVVARVVESAPHPDSDRLSVNKVDAGTGELLDVVCGAPNVRAGKMYPFAKTGTVMPGGLKIERRKIRGAVSNGMLCSARELGLGEEHDGILELDVDVPPGTPFLDVMAAGDTRIVVDVLPNRPDLLSHLGIAREVAAALGKPVRAREAVDTHIGAAASEATPAVRDAREAAADGVRVVLEDAEGAPRYLGAVIRGVKVGPSPEWLVRRLEGVGSRSINNVVDATNFMLHGFGQPMHAFDLAKLAGGAVVVRRARAGETLVTLDGVERKLTPDMTVIADAERAQAIAGVMGGQESEVGDATSDIFLEVAAFEPRRVRRTRRAVGLSTDASYRFERGIDGESAASRLMEAVRLITALAGGQLAGAPVDLYPVPALPRALRVRTDRVRRLLGEVIPAREIVDLLASIGFAADVAPGSEMLVGNEEIVVGVPSWRSDIEREVDVIEEVARLYGYDRLPSDIRPFRPSAVPDAPLEIVSRRLRDVLSGQGLYEVRPMPFVSGDDATHARVLNPLAENEAHLRVSLLETLARRAEFNLAHMQSDVRLFEIGDVFARRDARLPCEVAKLGVLVMGHRRPPHFTEPRPPVYDEWDAKALAEHIAAVAFEGKSVALAPADDEASDALGRRLWDIAVDGRVVGQVLRLALDVPAAVPASAAFGIEFELAVVDSADVAPSGKSAHAGTAGAAETAGARVHPQFRPLPTTPAADVDLALLVPEGTPAASVESVLRRSAGDLLERLELFDEFRGEGVPAGYRSLAWRLTFRDPARTLRDKEVEGRKQKILRTLEGELGVRQRTA